MITVTDAGIQGGYTGLDHLIDDYDRANVYSVVGRTFRSVGAAKKAAERAYESACDSRVRLAHVWVTVLLPNGEQCTY